MRPLVLDTNVVLDWFVFDDPRTASLRAALDAHEATWITTVEMRDELAHVLAYPNLARRVPDAQAVLTRFDASARLVEVAPRSTLACRDADDQKFIDLAVAEAATLLSKDKEVLRLRRKLAPVGVDVRPVY